MFHPVGSQSATVYWRRRLVLVASIVALVVLLVLTARTLFAGDANGAPSAGGPGTHAPGAHAPAGVTTAATRRGSHSDPPKATLSSSAPSSTTTPTTSPTATTTPTTSPTAKDSAQPARSSSSRPAPARCSPKQLAVQAVVGTTQYAVGDHPVLTLQVTNTGKAACVQNVADSQILLRVYDGTSRVWGSHDCKIEPGVDKRTLWPDKPAGLSIVWSGLTSRPKCAGTRQRVGAGTYTLYASLSGHQGRAQQFVIS
jgi:hypothetical protein